MPLGRKLRQRRANFVAEDKLGLDQLLGPLELAMALWQVKVVALETVPMEAMALADMEMAPLFKLWKSVDLTQKIIVLKNKKCL
jgi:hypothetical protein